MEIDLCDSLWLAIYAICDLRFKQVIIYSLWFSDSLCLQNQKLAAEIQIFSILLWIFLI